MPQIESWLRLPAAIRDHLVERMRDRNINLDLNRLRIWINLKLNVPEGAWFKDFGSFKLCGKVSFPRHSGCEERWHEESHCEAEAKSLHP
jgi:hypothetical protein